MSDQVHNNQGFDSERATSKEPPRDEAESFAATGSRERTATENASPQRLSQQSDANAARSVADAAASLATESRSVDAPPPVDGLRGSRDDDAAEAPSSAAKQRQASPRWRCNAEALDAIVAVGFSRNVAEKALFYTGNASADQAVCWILEHPEAQADTSLVDEELRDLNSESSSDSEEFVDTDRVKMVFVVNSDLKMGLGKIAAQTAHAALGLYRSLMETSADSSLRSYLRQWHLAGETKIVVKGENSDHLLQLCSQAENMGVANYLVRDAGRTQIAAGSITVFAIFGPAAFLDAITGQLKLL